MPILDMIFSRPGRSRRGSARMASVSVPSIRPRSIRSAMESCGEVGVHRGRAAADQHREVVRVDALGRADVERGEGPQALAGQPGMHRAGREDHRHRDPRPRPGAGRSARCGWRPRAPPPRPRRGSARARRAGAVVGAGGEGAVDVDRPRRRTARTIAVELARSTTNGLSSCRISVWLLSSSSTFLRLPNRVLRLHHPVLAQLSIGGLVTWLKFWRK